MADYGLGVEVEEDLYRWVRLDYRYMVVGQSWGGPRARAGASDWATAWAGVVSERWALRGRGTPLDAVLAGRCHCSHMRPSTPAVAALPVSPP